MAGAVTALPASYGPGVRNFGNVVLQFGNDNKADGVAGGHTLTAVGNFQWDDAQKPTGLASSGLSDGTGDELKTNSAADLGVGTGDFTVEGYYRLGTQANSTSRIIGNLNGAAWAANHWIIGNKDAVDASATAKLKFYVNNYNASSPMLTGTTSINDSAWHHVAVVRSGNNWYLFVDGTQEATASSAVSLDGGAAQVITAMSSGNGESANGHVAGLRFTRAARWTTNFTPPTLPLVRGSADSSWANVVLLALQENAADATTTFKDYSLYDQSTRDHVITAAGNAQYDTAQAPTGLTSSLLLDGTGDYYTVPDSSDFDMATGDATWEAFVRMPTLATAGVFAKRTVSANYAPFVLSIDATNINILMSQNGSSWAVNASGAHGMSNATWYHVAWVKQGNNLTGYVNGVSKVTGTLTGAVMTNTSTVAIGAAASDGTSAFNGHIAGVRITKGTARYTSAFTPPSLPYGTDYPVATGGTITSAGNFKIHSFTSSSTFRVNRGAGGVEYLVVAGGGGGGSNRGGGGGAGGYRTNAALNYVVTAQGYTVTVGGGGAGAVNTGAGADGSNSVFDTITSTGGGGGAGAGATTGRNGGSAGGGAGTGAPGSDPGTDYLGGTGTAGQGNNGGNGANSGGGGGGASAVGANVASRTSQVGANGGAGTSNSITGTWTERAGGGGGAGETGGGTATGGGGAGGNNSAGTNATANTGGGGGGGSDTGAVNGGNGGSGIVIVKYKYQ